MSLVLVFIQMLHSAIYLAITYLSMLVRKRITHEHESMMLSMEAIYIVKVSKIGSQVSVTNSRLNMIRSGWTEGHILYFLCLKKKKNRHARIHTERNKIYIKKKKKNQGKEKRGGLC